MKLAPRPSRPLLPTSRTSSGSSPPFSKESADTHYPQHDRASIVEHATMSTS